MADMNVEGNHLVLAEAFGWTIPDVAEAIGILVRSLGAPSEAAYIAQRFVKHGIDGSALLTGVDQKLLCDPNQLNVNNIELRTGILFYIEDLRRCSWEYKTFAAGKNKYLNRAVSGSMTHTRSTAKPRLASDTAPNTPLLQTSDAADRPHKQLKLETVAASSAAAGRDILRPGGSYYNSSQHTRSDSRQSRHEFAQSALPGVRYTSRIKPSSDFRHFPIHSVFLPDAESGDNINADVVSSNFYFDDQSYSRLPAAPYVLRSLQRSWLNPTRTNFACGESNGIAIPLYPERLVPMHKDIRQPAIAFTPTEVKVMDSADVLSLGGLVNHEVEQDQRGCRTVRVGKRLDSRAILRRIEDKESDMADSAWDAIRQRAVQAVEPYCDGGPLLLHDAEEVSESINSNEEEALRWHKITAAIVRLVDQSGLRVGNAKSVDNGGQAADHKDRRKKKSRALSKRDVHRIIDLEVLSYRALWNIWRKGLYRAHSFELWKADRSQGARYQRIRALEARMHTITNRLHSLCGRFDQDHWYRRSEVKKTCQVLRETVFTSEATKFLLELCHRNDAPNTRLPLAKQTSIRTPKRLREATKRFKKAQMRRLAGMSFSERDMALFGPAIGGQATVHASEDIAHSDVSGGDQFMKAVDPSDLSDFIVNDLVHDPPTIDKRAAAEREDALIHDEVSSQKPAAPKVIDLSSDDDDDRSDIVIIKTTATGDVSTHDQPTAAITDLSDNSDDAPDGNEAEISDLGGRPEHADAEEVRNWSLNSIWLKKDRVRLLVKAVHSLDAMKVTELHTEKAQYAKKPETFWYHMHLYFVQVQANKSSPLHMPAKKTLLNLRGLYELFDFAFLHGQVKLADYQKLFIAITSGGQSSGGIEKVAKRKTKGKGNSASNHSWPEFLELVYNVLDHWKGQQMLSTNMDNKKKIKQTVIRERFKRHAGLDEPDRALLHPTDLSTHTEDCKFIPINLEQPPDRFIYVDCNISVDLREHQIEGVRFMWREIVAADEGEGCLLSHTMGLGKTLQVFTLLEAIARASKSSNPRIVQQIPPHLHKPRVLILCPKTLLDNWAAEYTRWILGRSDYLVQCHNAALLTSLQALSKALEIWFAEGGVFIVGYQTFARIVHGKRVRGYGAEEVTRMKHLLLEGPNIVVADEAHQLKNEGAQVTQAAGQFKTKSRIALTGTPLANSLEEYWSMINWISPDYLGDAQSFRKGYQQQIALGMYMDNEEKSGKLARRQLNRLKKLLEPKVHRRDVTILQSMLQPKTEFIVFVPLTPLQHLMYDVYIDELDADEGESAVRVFGWLNILSLLCTHPMLFLNKLQERQRARKDKAIAATTASPSNISTTPKSRTKMPAQPDLEALAQSSDWDALVDATLDQMASSDRLVARISQVMSELPDPNDRMHSHKLSVLWEILGHAEVANDKVIVFSQYATTLSYLSRLLSAEDIKTYHLDGTTKDRLSVAQAFNTDPDWAVFLVSVKTGGVGLNLVGANRIVTFDHLFNPMWEVQAIGRAYRMGQKKPVFVYHLSCGGTFEVAIHQTQFYKNGLAAGAVEGRFFKQKSWKMETFVFKYQGCPKKDLSEWKGRDSKVLDKILVDEDCLVSQVETDENLMEEMDEGLEKDEEGGLDGWEEEIGKVGKGKRKEVEKMAVEKENVNQGIGKESEGNAEELESGQLKRANERAKSETSKRPRIHPEYEHPTGSFIELDEYVMELD